METLKWRYRDGYWRCVVVRGFQEVRICQHESLFRNEVNLNASLVQHWRIPAERRTYYEVVGQFPMLVVELTLDRVVNRRRVKTAIESLKTALVLTRPGWFEKGDW